MHLRQIISGIAVLSVTASCAPTPQVEKKSEPAETLNVEVPKPRAGEPVSPISAATVSNAEMVELGKKLFLIPGFQNQVLSPATPATISVWEAVTT